MSNRLTSGGSGSHSGGTGRMMPGDTRAIFDPKSQRGWLLTRTHREYVFDQADALNAPLIGEGKPMRWDVQHNGELSLRVLGEGRDALANWKPADREIEVTKAVCAEFAADPHLTQEQFNAMARSGRITRIVDQRLAQRAAA